ncbi:hypothetical protein COU96_00375 [Candidatus Shapirobacteria bacterium CG10_big_fil_rev_8_21_14_0_10_38_14]|uniref:Membrane insertase YidC/Oxa/ALB C-terminal domain-containing protein n=1 Tax=Candidatus Shapirobacteria bacterium CG10_big_fil_rev_8_21_14_0_10_38_14 TaxID=1974483 RepID=A0A2M8L661_9BACT|nr:MAG: hypothetical protein COU96_00375 [Candidatus Shapirobacteria bacterium CG10_big_fil_rev_8_21_14_0_10_38_14]
MWQTVLYQPIVNALVFLNQLFGNFGIAVIVLTIAIRFLLIPLTLPSLKATSKMRELAPELEKLKKKHGKDKQKLAQAQMELYKQHGVNPASGCLPQIIQIVILIALYQAFNQVLKMDGGTINKLNEVLYPQLKLPLDAVINTRFLWLNLNQPDIFRLPGLSFSLPGFFLIAAALIQVISSKMMQPAVELSQKKAEKTETKQDDIASAMQSQMLYLFPLMTILIGYSFPSGLVLYWLVFSISTAIQQYFVSGWGGLEPWLKKIKR